MKGRSGYARASAAGQEFAVQRDASLRLGGEDRIYVDNRPTRARRTRLGLREAMATCWPEDALVIPELDRLAPSLPDAGDITRSEPPRKGCRHWAAASTNPTSPEARCCSTC